MSEATRFEMMLLTGARQIRNHSVLFVGFHWPMIMARIARRLHAPDIVEVYENGIVQDRLTSVVPTAPTDLTAAEGAPMCGNAVDSLFMFLANQQIDLVILEAPIVDRFGNINTTAVGDYYRPTVRMPGSGGGTELASFARNLLLVNASSAKRQYPERVDYITSPGYLEGRKQRESLGYIPGTGPKTLVTPLGLFGFREDTGEMFLRRRHAGVELSEVREGFGWDIAIDEEGEPLAPPTKEELEVVRAELAAAQKRAYRLPQ